MVASNVSVVPNGRIQFLGVDITGPWRFLCSKDRFDWGMASHAGASLWVLEFYFPTVYWSTYPQEADKHQTHISPERIGSISMTLIEWTFLTQWPAIVLFSSATYLFTNYNHRAVGLLPNSSRIFSLDYSTWVLERRRNMAWRPSSRPRWRLWQI